MRNRDRSSEDIIDLSDPVVQELLHRVRVLSGIGRKLMYAPGDGKTRTPHGRRIMAQRRLSGRIARRARAVNFRRARVARQLRQKKNRRYVK